MSYIEVFTYADYAVTLTGGPNDYATISLSWQNPIIGNYVRLLRSSTGPPVNETDGEILLNQAVVREGSVVITKGFEETPPGTLAGQVVYYSIWVQLDDSSWQRGGDLQTVLPIDWGYTSLLKQLPLYVLGEDFNLGGQQDSFLNLLAWGASTTRTWLEQLRNVASPYQVPANLLGALSAMLGLSVEQEIGYTQTRRLLANIAHLYREKGTVAGVAGITSALTGWSADAAVGPNLILMRDLVGEIPAKTGLTTTVVLNEKGVPAPPLSYNEGAYSSVFPSQWPLGLPGYVDRLPAQAWFAAPGAGNNPIEVNEPFTLSTLSDGDPMHYGIPLPSAINHLGNSSSGPATLTTSTTFTLGVNPRTSTWDASLWTTAVWEGFPTSIPTPAPTPGLSVFAIAQTSLPNGQVGSAYSYQLSTQNAQGVVSWFISDGALPPGLNLDTTTGRITGNPGAQGGSTFTVSASEPALETVTPGVTCNASIRVWTGNTGGPTAADSAMLLQVHFWGAFGADLGVYAATQPITVPDQSWRDLNLQDAPVPIEAVWASLEVVVTGSEMVFVPGSSSDASVFIAAMPTFEIGAGSPAYTNPRDIEITVHADRTNFLYNPSFEGTGAGSTAGWTIAGGTLTAIDSEHAVPPVANPGTWSGQLTSAAAADMSITADPVPISPEYRYSVGLYLRSADGVSYPLKFSYIWIDHIGVVLRTDTFDAGYSSSAWTLMTVPTSIPPATATACSFQVTWVGCATGAIEQIDCVLFEASDYPGEYFDGSAWADSIRFEDYLWYDPANLLGPSFYYANRLAKVSRLEAVLAGEASRSLGGIDPFSLTGFLPLGATYTLFSDQIGSPEPAGSIFSVVGLDTFWGTGVWGVNTAWAGGPRRGVENVAGNGSRTSAAVSPQPAAAPAVSGLSTTSGQGGQLTISGVGSGLPPLGASSSLLISSSALTAYVSSGISADTAASILTLGNTVVQPAAVLTGNSGSTLSISGFITPGPPPLGAGYTGAAEATTTIAAGVTASPTAVSTLSISGNAADNSDLGWGASIWGVNVWS